MQAEPATADGTGSTIRYVDTHCHLDDESFRDDLGAVLERSAALGVDRQIIVGFAPERWASSLAIAVTYPGVSCMLGVHPGHADEWEPVVRDELMSLVAETRPVAIGEIGLDFYRGETNLSRQRNAFVDQLGLAVDFGLPAVIHMRDATSEVLDILRSTTPLPPLVFHSFDGTNELTDWILDNGATIGVGGLATRGKAGELRNLIRRIPLDRIVLETDSPYLVPQGFKHRRNTPESIPAIARSLALLHDCPVDDVASITTSWAERVFPGILSTASSWTRA